MFGAKDLTLVVCESMIGLQPWLQPCLSKRVYTCTALQQMLDNCCYELVNKYPQKWESTKSHGYTSQILEHTHLDNTECNETVFGDTCVPERIQP